MVSAAAAREGVRVFMTALYLAGMIAGPVSGAILSYFDGAAA